MKKKLAELEVGKSEQVSEAGDAPTARVLKVLVYKLGLAETSRRLLGFAIVIESDKHRVLSLPKLPLLFTCVCGPRNLQFLFPQIQL